MGRAVDFRVRPPYGGYQAFADSITPDYIEGFGLRYTGAVATKPLEDLLADCAEAGVSVDDMYDTGFAEAAGLETSE